MIPDLSLRLCQFGYCLMYSYVILLVMILIPLIIFIIYKNFVKFNNDLERKEYVRSRRGIRLFMLYSRLFIFLCLAIAIATPLLKRL